jgi:probable F420-dependent oxidoreductase
MAHPRPFRFGVTAHDAHSGDEWCAFARKIEDLGFATLMVPDHFGTQLAPVSALAVAATSTTTLRVSMLVAANDFRHPVVHAKELATLDVMSGGRVDWGVGAGWLAPEYKAAGLTFDKARVRVDRLAEAITVMKGLFSDGPVTHTGPHYRVTELDGYPKPVQRPHPPLLVGGAKRRMLTLAGREADIVGLAPLPNTDSDAPVTRDRIEENLTRQQAWIRAGAGDRYRDLEIAATAFPVIVDGDHDARTRRLGGRLSMEPEAVVASPHMLVGDVERICDTLEAHRARWDVSYVTVAATAVDTFAPVVARLAGT